MANFTPQQIEQFLQEFFDVVGARQYVGARYVPIFGRAGEGTVEWDDRAPYEPLTVVMHEGVSYVSRRYVPQGIQITDTAYWVETYRFNAQVEQYRQEVLAFDGRITANARAIEAEATSRQAADAGVLTQARDEFVPFPDESVRPKYGISGQVLETLGDGETQWVDPVTVTSDVAGPIIDEWLDDHPEATTTVLDGSITTAKLADGAVTWDKLDQEGGIVSVAGAIKRALSDSGLLPVADWSDMVPGKYVSWDTGVIHDLQTFCVSDEIPVHAGDVVLFYGCSGGSQLAYYGLNDTYKAGQQNVYDGVPVRVPSDDSITYLRWCTELTKRDEVCIYISSFVDMTNVVNAIETGDDILKAARMTDGYYVPWNTGQPSPLATFTLTDMIPVRGGQVFAVTGSASGTQYAFYDSDGEYVRGFVLNDMDELAVPLDEGIAYLRYSFPTANLASSSIRLKYVMTGRHLRLNENMITKTLTLPNHYVNYVNGQVPTLNNMTATDLIRVCPMLELTFTGGTNAAQGAYYDATGTFVSGFRTQTDTTLTVPDDDDIVWMRWSFETSQLATASVISQGFAEPEPEPEPVQPDTYVINQTEGLLAGLKSAYAAGIGHVVVNPGTYDVIQEYEAFYGSDYFSTYTAYYNNLTNGPWDRGLWLDDVDVEFRPGAKVACMYAGSNTNVNFYFSAFACGSNATVTGLTLESDNVRYAIHPDFHPQTQERLIFSECDIKHTNGPNGTEWGIGCGTGVNSWWTFERCVFRVTTAGAAVSIHNNASEDAIGRIEFTNCYVDGPGYIRIAYYGASTAVTPVLIAGCSYPTAPLLTPENASATIVNMAIIDCNNELRS